MSDINAQMPGVTEVGMTCPRGDPSLPWMVFDLSESAMAERRLHELAIVNAGTAPSFCSDMAKGYACLKRILPVLRYEYVRAINRAKRRRAEVVLDVAPGILQAKGLIGSRNPAGSEDLREAVVSTDSLYVELQDRADMLNAMHELIAGKAETLKMAYYQARKAMDPIPAELDHNPTSTGGGIDGEIGVPNYRR